MRSCIAGGLAALGLLAGPACAADPERGLESRHQPVVVGKTASVPGCPDWSDVLAHSRPFEGMASNYGCATNSNLAAMVADPADLLRGREAEGSAAETATRAIKAWRETQPTGKNGLEKVSVKSAGGSQ